MSLWLQHVIGMMKDDTKCWVVFGGKGLCATLVKQLIGGLLVARSKIWKETL